MECLKKSISILSSIDYGKDRVQSSPTSGNRQIESLVDLEIEINRMIDEQARRKHEAINMIQKLTRPEHMRLLYKRYVQYEYFEKIALDLGYSYSRTIHMHRDALSELDALLKVSI